MYSILHYGRLVTGFCIVKNAICDRENHCACLQVPVYRYFIDNVTLYVGIRSIRDEGVQLCKETRDILRRWPNIKPTLGECAVFAGRTS